jgi:hypothetical protein
MDQNLSSKTSGITFADLQREIADLAIKQQQQERLMTLQSKTLADIVRQILVITEGSANRTTQSQPGGSGISRGQGISELAVAILRAVRRQL